MLIQIDRDKMDSSVLRHTRSRIYWIGGSPCSGKSSIVRLLAERHDFTSYNCDDAFGQHGRTVTPEKQPRFHRVMHSSWDEIWMRPVDELVEDEWAIYGEQWSLIVDDLLRLPADRPIVAEGAALLPELVQPILADREHAVWIVPTEAFQRTMYPRRGDWVKDVLKQCTYPQRAFQNWMDRDAAFARHIERQCRELGLHLLAIDGTCSIEENAHKVEALFFNGTF